MAGVEATSTLIAVHITMLSLLLFALLAEVVLHKLEHAAQKYKHLMAVLERLYKELMILGMTAFFLFFESKSGLTDVFARAFREPFDQHTVELVHILLFVASLFFIFTSILILLYSVRYARSWSGRETGAASSSDAALVEYNALVSARQNSSFLNRIFNVYEWYRIYQCHERVRYFRTRKMFLIQNQLHDKFDFSNYLRKCIRELTTELIDIQRVVWAGLVGLIMVWCILSWALFLTARGCAIMMMTSQILICVSTFVLWYKVHSIFVISLDWGGHAPKNLSPEEIVARATGEAPPPGQLPLGLVAKRLSAFPQFSSSSSPQVSIPMSSSSSSSSSSSIPLPPPPPSSYVPPSPLSPNSSSSSSSSSTPYVSMGSGDEGVERVDSLRDAFLKNLGNRGLSQSQLAESRRSLYWFGQPLYTFFCFQGLLLFQGFCLSLYACVYASVMTGVMHFLSLASTFIQLFILTPSIMSKFCIVASTGDMVRKDVITRTLRSQAKKAMYENK